MRVLVACEFSGIVREEFKKLGHDAWSCDLLPTEIPGNHYQGNVLDIINDDWDLMIAHPPCTYLTVTGNRWFNIERYGDKAKQRIENREEAKEFFMKFANADCEKICIENPLGFMSSYWRKPDQIIQPYMFGDPFEKRTCLWLKGIPNLIPTNIIKPPERKKFKSGKSMPSWYEEVWHLPKEQRASIRSKTFPGIARAMAEQWGTIIDG